MKLIELTSEHYDQFIDFADDFSSSGDNRYEDRVSKDSYKQFLINLESSRNEETTPSHLVPYFSYFLQDDSQSLLGSIRYRTRLNPSLLIEGGHIGYDIRPSKRNLGLATKMLGLLLEEIKDVADEKVLITCFDDNPASERVILKHGGILESIKPSPRSGKMSKRFWVDVPRMEK